MQGQYYLANIMKYKFKHSVVGGTFDRMHKGHESLLASGFSRSERVTIGITSNEFAKRRLKNNFEDYEIRLKQLEDFLRKNSFFERAKIIKLVDVFGPTLSDATIDSIFVTKETIEGAEAINSKRVKIGLRKLRINVVPMALGQRRSAISSTEIRLGKMDRFGFDYFLKIGANKFVLPDQLRDKIAEPQGKIISEKDLSQLNLTNYSRVITVGDIVTKTFVKHKLRFNLAVVDLKANRKKVFKSIIDLGISTPNKLTVVKNRRGTVSKSLTRAIRDMLINNFEGAVIRVIGEEDLAVIPAVILSPLGSIIFYGQRSEGIVLIKVEEKTKEKFLKIIDGFKKF